MYALDFLIRNNTNDKELKFLPKKKQNLNYQYMRQLYVKKLKHNFIFNIIHKMITSVKEYMKQLNRLPFGPQLLSISTKISTFKETIDLKKSDPELCYSVLDVYMSIKYSLMPFITYTDKRDKGHTNKFCFPDTGMFYCDIQDESDGVYVTLDIKSSNIANVTIKRRLDLESIKSSNESNKSNESNE